MTVTILQGGVRDRLRGLADESINCVVTSPPYWGLRDYGVVGQIGLEPSIFDHIELLVDVFREVRRVLRKDGTLWLNYGDAYSGSGKGGNPGPNGMQDRNKGSLGVRGVRRSPFKDKDRMLLPARVAIALQDDGWWIRDEIIWSKPNPMPSSVRDRTTPAHEMIYLLTKSARYVYDFNAMQEPAIGKTPHDLTGPGQSPPGQTPQRGNRAPHPTGWATHKGAHGKIHRDGKENGKTNKQQQTADASNKNTARTMGGFNARWDKKEQTPPNTPAMRNKRSVWSVAPQALPEAHFATFPPKLIEPCILAGCPIGGTVLDPFFGAGTTGLVAQQHGRNCIGIELNPEYVLIATRRLGLGLFG